MIGQTFGVYKILEKRGEGGMGIFYKAHDEVLDEIVGLKTLHRELVSDAKFQQDLQAEAKLQARLRDHPHIVRLNHYLIHEGRHFLVMEYVEGHTLSEKIADGGPYTFSDAAKIVFQVLDALRYAHQNGVVHRDIKPSNIMLTDEEVVKVTDFGIAKLIDVSQKTRTAQAKGSLYYMPPEQIEHGQIDGRTDIYALGITLFEMLTGTVPFTAETDYLIMKKHLEEAAPAPSTFNSAISKAQDELVLHAMEKEPANRFQSTDQFAAAIKDVLSFSKSEILPTLDRVAATVPRIDERRGEPPPPPPPPPPPKPIWKKLLYTAVIILGIFTVTQYIVGWDIHGLIVGFFKSTSRNGETPEMVSHSPRWAPIGDKTIVANDTLAFTVQANDQDNDPLYLEIIGDVPPFSWFEDNRDNTGTFSMAPKPADVGEYEVTFVASDGENADTTEMLIMVNSPRRPEPTTTLTVDVDPFNQRSKVTAIWVDGRQVAKNAPYDLKGLSPGRHWVRIETSYGSLTDTVTWTGTDRRLSFFLSESYGRVSVWARFLDGENFANIHVDDRDIGRGTPFEVRNLLVGPHEIEVKKDGYRTTSGPRIIRIKPTEKSDVGFEMRRR